MSLKLYNEIKDNIVVLSSITPITLSKELLDDKTDQFLVYLLSIKDFEKIYRETRETYNINNKKWDINQYIGKNLKDTKIFENRLLHAISYALPKQYLGIFGENEDIYLELFLIIFFNATLPASYFEQFLSDSFEFIVGKKAIAGRMTELSDYETAAILIPFNTSRNLFDKWLDKNWKKVVTPGLYSYFELSHPIMKERQNFRVAIITIIMKDDLRKSYREISDYLMGRPKFEGDNRVCDTDFLKKIYKQFKKHIKESQKKLVRQALLKEGIKK